MSWAVSAAQEFRVPAVIERSQAPEETAEPAKLSLLDRIVRRGAKIAAGGILGGLVGAKVGSMIIIPIVAGCAAVAFPLTVPIAVAGVIAGVAVGSAV